jgi:hypothetical protein
MIKTDGRQIFYDGAERWYLKGDLHREDGPAVIETDGTEWWYLNGRIHREDGPAITFYDGSKFWYRHDKKHREDGPAVIDAAGRESWYINGVPIEPPDPMKLLIDEVERLDYET